MSGRPLSVLHVCDEVGLGGTERGIVSMCRTMRYGVLDHSVVCLRAQGARASLLEGHAPVQVATTAAQVRKALEERSPDVVIFHRAGAQDRRWNNVLELLRPLRGGIAVIEINIFGLVDDGPSDSIFDWHLHISKASYCSFRRRAEASRYPRVDRHRVLYIPLELRALSASKAGTRVSARAALGIRDSEFVLLRTGRPDVRKWGDLLLSALPTIAQRIPEARFVFLSAPSSRAWYMRRQSYGDKVTVLPVTPDDASIARAYQAADVYFHSSRRGESYGASLVEAMGMSLPVVVDSTPKRDNAQVEVVDHMSTGIIANSPDAFADAVTQLWANPEMRSTMGAKAREKALSAYDSAVVCRSLAGLIGQTLTNKGQRVPDAPELVSEVHPSPDEIERYWTHEEAERSRQGWANVAPRADPLFFHHPAWALLDACEVAARKLGVIR